VDHSRVAAVGPDRAAAEWVLRLGGSVKFTTLPQWSSDYNRLPSEPQGYLQLEAIDVSGVSITDNGLEHLAGLEVLSSLKMKGCQYITDVAISHVSVVCGSLTELDISHCHGISAAGLHYLHCLRSARLECYLMCTAFELISMQSVQGISLVPMIDCGGKPGVMARNML